MEARQPAAQAAGPHPRRSTEEGADRAFILNLVVFGLLALGLVLVIGFLST
jgi:hypothetical protein